MTSDIRPSILLLGNNESAKSWLLDSLTIDFPEHSVKRSNVGISEWRFVFNKMQIVVEVEESADFTRRGYLEYSKRTGPARSLIIVFANPAVLDDDQYLKCMDDTRENQTVIVVYQTESRRSTFDNKELQARKKKYPFVRYWLFMPLRPDWKMNLMNPTRLMIRQILVNAFTDRLEYARTLIKENLKKKDPLLDIGRCGLTSLYEVPEIFRNKHIQTLIVSNEWGEQSKAGRWSRKKSRNEGRDNVLYDLPKEIKAFGNLRVLIIGGNWNSKSGKVNPNKWRIEDVSVLSKLPQLEILNASNNEIFSMTGLTWLSKLKDLYLNNNRIESLPPLGKMKALERLYISNNRLVKVKALTSVPSLQTVDLHSNQLEDLRSIEPVIARLGIQDTKWEQNTINVANNPLVIPAQSLIAQGKDGVVRYLRQQRAEQEIKIPPYLNRDIKLILIGNSNVGKSTLVHWLTKNVVKKNIGSTHWLEVVEWNPVRQKSSYRVRIFDFGGQEYYHDTHYIFFTNRTAYLLLWDKESNKFEQTKVMTAPKKGVSQEVTLQNFPIEYWLDSVDYHTRRKKAAAEMEVEQLKTEREGEVIEYDADSEDSDSTTDEPVVAVDEQNMLIVQNKVEKKIDKAFLNQALLKSKHLRISDFSSISVHEGIRVKDLVDSLFEIFEALEVVKQEFLGTWGVIKQAIEHDASLHGPLTITEFEKYCNGIIRKMPEINGKSAKQVRQVLFTQGDTRLFAQFLNDIGMALYYPENETLRDKILLNREEILTSIYEILVNLKDTDGVFTREAAAKAIKAKPEDEHTTQILSLMLHFRIIFEHPSQANTFIAPLYLPAEPPKSITLFLSLFRKPRIRYLYTGFIHKYVVLHFFSQYGKKALSADEKSLAYYYWRDGIILKSDISDEVIMVRFQSGSANGQNSFVEIYTMSVNPTGAFQERIEKDLEKINEGWQVEKQVSADGTEFIPLTEIHRYEKAGIGWFEFLGKQYKLAHFKHFLQDPLRMKKIFISYSKLDLAYVNKFLEHLSALQLDGKVAHWYCSELVAGSDWNKEIQRHFDEADIVCFMISPNFMKTKYIHEHEIANAFERIKTDTKFKIVPIILDFCRWTTINNDLSKFTALPYTAKPVADFQNPNMAWFIIEACLRAMIDDDLNPTGDDFYISNDRLPSDVMGIYKRIVAGTVDRK